MAPAIQPNLFVFNGQQTIADLVLVAAALERAGHRPSLRFVRYKEDMDGVAVEYAVASEKPSPRFELTPIGRNVLEESGEMAIGGCDELPDSAP